MPPLLSSSSTQKQLQAIVKRSPQSLLVLGEPGSGRSYLTSHIVAEFLNITTDKLNNYPYYALIKPDGSSVKTEQIRQIKQLLNLKLPGKNNGLRRFVVIESANLMTKQSQNAALKFIEEPPEDTLIILIANSQHDLLPTIVSRCMVLRLNNPSLEEARAYASQRLKLDAGSITQPYMISDGRPGLLTALLAGDNHILVSELRLAKDILGFTNYERLAAIEPATKDRSRCKLLLFALERIASVGLITAAAKGQPGITQLKKWQKVLTAVTTAQQHLMANCNSKLVLTNLMLTL